MTRQGRNPLPLRAMITSLPQTPRIVRAARLARAISANVAHWYADQYDEETFRSRNRRLWARANRDGLLVSALLRGDLDDAATLSQG